MLQTLGSLLLVCGVSYHLARSSWQLVLLSFVAAGIGYAIWKVRKAIIRRAKIKALWKRSLEIEAMLEQMEEPLWARIAAPQRSAAATEQSMAAAEKQSDRPAPPRKTCVALDHPIGSKATAPSMKSPSVDAQASRFRMDKWACMRD